MRASPPARSAEPLLELSSPLEWSQWLEANHTQSGAVWLRISKKGADKTISYPEALDAALAWGWIDSQKRTLDDVAWAQRFSARKADSPWSKINRAKAEQLIAAGAMKAPGLAEVERARRDGRWERAYDGSRSATVPEDLAQALAQNDRAKAFFEALDGANRYAILYRVQTAKTPKTRAERVARFVAMCERHETIHPAVERRAARPRTKQKDASLSEKARRP